MTIETALAGVDVGALIGGDAAASAKARLLKLTDGAHQFEAMMLEEMLKPLKFGGGLDASGDSADSAGDTIQGYGTEALAKAISDGGGFGLAKQIVAQVAAEDRAKTGERKQQAGGKV